MESDNETVAEIVSDMRNRDYYRGFMGITNPLTDRMVSNLLDRIEAAHKREVDSLNFKLMTAMSEQKTVANVLIEQTNRAEKLEREVDELRECLRMAVVNTRIDRTCRAFGRECDTCGQSCDARKWNKVIEATKGANNDNSSCQNH